MNVSLSIQSDLLKKENNKVIFLTGHLKPISFMQKIKICLLTNGSFKPLWTRAVSLLLSTYIIKHSKLVYNYMRINDRSVFFWENSTIFFMRFTLLLFFSSHSRFCCKFPLETKELCTRTVMCEQERNEVKRSISMCGFKHTINNRCYHHPPTADRTGAKTNVAKGALAPSLI